MQMDIDQTIFFIPTLRSSLAVMPRITASPRYDMERNYEVNGLNQYVSAGPSIILMMIMATV